MRHASHVLTIGALGVAACTQPITAASSRLQGNWRTAAIPSGSGIDLSLVTRGSSVSGSGHQYALQYLRYTFTITGTLDPDGSTFRLTLTSDSGTTFTLSGRLVGSDELQGELGPPVCTPAGCEPESVTFVRQAE
jgi:hypothetical protein